MRVDLPPRSLFGRMVLVLMAGLLLGQLAGTAIQFQDRGRSVYQASGVQSAERIADLVRLLDAVGAGERARLVRVLNSSTLRLSVSRRPPAVHGSESEHDRLSSAFAALLRRNLGDGRPVWVTVTEHAPVLAPLPDREGGEDDGMRHGMGHHDDEVDDEHGMGGHGGMGMHQWRRMGRVGLLPLEGLAFAARVQLRDGAWMNAQQHVPDEVFAWPRRLLGMLLVLFASVLVFSVVAVRWATHPLSLLAHAAQRLGRDIHGAPLPETGPLEVRRAARAFNTMQARLERYIEDRTRILSALSHDLKTPITRLRLRAELVEDPDLRASISRDLDEMQHMTVEVLELLRGMEGKEAPRPIDIPALLEAIQDDVEETGGELAMGPITAAPYPGRPLALKRCIANLVENAVRYAGRARVEVRDAAEVLEVRVADEGPGIPEEYLEQVFEPFFRVEASRSRESGGTGLGLSIARNIARAHGGDLVLENRGGGGLVAVLTLPR